MRPLDKWRRLPAARRAALPGALAAVAVVRLFLRFLPWRMWGRVAARIPRHRPSPGSVATAVQDVAWAVRCVSRFVPRATCLTQALAAQLLLARRGCASRLTIGVARAPGGRLRAHAWLESDGFIVVGGAGLEAYTPLSASAANSGFVVEELSAGRNALGFMVCLLDHFRRARKAAGHPESRAKTPILVTEDQ